MAQNDAASPDGPAAQLEPIEPATARQNLLDADGFLAQYENLTRLEQQALQLISDEPLKLGALGTAILTIYPASFTGHLAMTKFYEFVGEPDTLAYHQDAINTLSDYYNAQGSGTQAQPWPVVSIYEAEAFTLHRQAQPAGAIYQSPPDFDLLYFQASQKPGGALEFNAYDLSAVLARYNDSQASRATPDNAQDDAAEAGADSENETTANEPWLFIRERARAGDNAAQAAIGAAYARYNEFEQATGWLTIASSSGNVLANTLLARLYHSQSLEEQDPERLAELKDLSLQNHMQAIAFGSTEAMYNLANLYISDYFGEENRGAAVPLLNQAADLDHASSLIYLGHLYNNGIEVETSTEQAKNYFKRAADTGDAQGVLTYGRFLFVRQATEPDDDIIAALKNLADGGNAQAMIVLGNLHARGYAVKSSARQAVRWYKRAVKQNPLNAEIVNEVAWTLTVSDMEKLRRTRYARRIMDHLMGANEDAAQRPEYLDTWAAAYAATRKFERAVEIQSKAINTAREQQRDDVLSILETHLALFEAKEMVNEATP